LIGGDLIRYYGLLAVSVLSAGLMQAEVVDLLATNLLYNTGVDPTGATLAAGSTDAHYQLFSQPGPQGFTATVQDASIGAPIPPWVGNTGTSAWIGLNSASSSGPVGTYDYRTTLDLTGIAHDWVNITGQWTTDNEGLDILVNGISTGNSIAYGSPGNYSFDHLTPFTLNTNFVDGVNTIDFVVYNSEVGASPNGPNPTGVQVEFDSATAATPEPGTLAMLMSGTALLLTSVRKTMKQKSQS
jgi:hypothetical protein